MMMNLFSIFDPLTMPWLALNWLSIMTPMMMFPMMYWKLPSNSQMFWIILFKTIMNEFKILIKKISFPNLIVITSLFFLIMTLNTLGLFPYIFTPTSHLMFNLSLSLPLWTTLMFYGWINNTKKMLIHLVPSGTPDILMPFMVLIESISNFIRPWTLSIRLSANMIAGHLLLTLLGSTCEKTMILFLIFLLSTQTMLMILETSVALIQSYVFSILSVLYMNESN